jgi:hypothetical protein
MSTSRGFAFISCVDEAMLYLENLVRKKGKKMVVLYLLTDKSQMIILNINKNERKENEIFFIIYLKKVFSTKEICTNFFLR